MELNNKNTIIIVLAIICITIIAGAILYLNSDGEINFLEGGANPFSEKEPAHIINATFSTDHTLDAKTICTINVGSNHSNENITVDVLYSRDGANLNDGDKSVKTVDSNGNIVCESKDSFDKYPDHASITLFDGDGNMLDRADISLATDDSMQVAIGNGTVTAKPITKAEHSASSSSSTSSSSSSSSSKGDSEWVEDLDLSDKAGYDCHVYIHHKSDGTKYYIDDEGKKHSAPESQEWVF